MPIVVNEFEILPEPSGEQRSSGSSSQPAATIDPAGLDPWAIIRVERTAKQRRRRLWAD